MKKTKKSIIALAIIVLFQLCGIGMQPIVAKAADLSSSFNFITDLNLTDGSGKALGNDVSKTSEVLVNYKFAIPNTSLVKAGDTYTMKIPKQIQIIKPISLDLKSANSEDVVAKVNIDTLGNVIVTFTDYSSSHSNISGYFYVDSYFNKSQIGDANPEKLVFNIGANSTKTIDINFHQQPVSPKTYLQKSGSYDSSKNQITWTIKTNPEKLVLNDVEIVDEIPAGQKYVENSATIDNKGLMSGFSYIGESNAEGTKSGTLRYKFNGQINSSYNIVFKTTVTDPTVFQSEGAKTTEYNQATLKHDGDKEELSNKAAVVVTTDYISKKGTYNPSTRSIDWVIKINNNGLSIKDARVRDPIPRGLRLNEYAIEVDGNSIGLDEYTTYDDVFAYTFQGTIQEPHTITFSTYVVDSSAYNSNKSNKYINTATLEAEGVPLNASDSNTVEVPSNIIYKSGSGYNAATGEITWKIIVNQNATNINNAVVTDYIPVGQEYVDESATIDEDSSGSFSYNAEEMDKYKTGTLKYYFDGPVGRTYTIIFKTKVTDPKVFAANTSKTYSNTASIIGEGIETSQSTGYQNVSSEVIRKDGTNYDYVTREATWTIIVNKNKMPIKDAVVTDVIPSGQSFVQDSLTLNGVKADNNNYSYDAASNTVNYSLGDIADTKIITLKTRVTDLSIFSSNGDKQINNIASLSGDIIPPNVSDPATITIKNSVINKYSNYVDGNSFIEWNIDVNSNQIPMEAGTIVDTLQEGLELDTTSVKLYKNIVNANGGLTKGEEVPLSINSVKYDKDTRTFTFKFPSTVQSAYKLVFTTNITDKSKSPFTNTATFKGSGSNVSSSTNPVTVRYQVAGGVSAGESGSIDVYKIDRDTNDKLNGAVFELLDQYKNVIKTSEPTDSQGKVTFNNLKFDLDYYIREKTAPKGYNLSDEVFKFQVSNINDKKYVSYNYKDGKIDSSETKNLPIQDQTPPVKTGEVKTNTDEIKVKNDEVKANTDEAKADPVTSTSDSNKASAQTKEAITDKTEVLPKTGALIDSNLLVILGIAIIASGVVLAKKKSR